MRRFQLLTTATLVALSAAIVAGCGGPALTGAQSHRASMSAKADVSWQRATTVIDLTDDRDFDVDMPDSNHPFAAPLKFRIYPKKDVGRVLELVAPTNDKPSRGFLLTEVDDAANASFMAEPEDEENEALAKRIKVNFKWGVNTAMATKDTAISAMPVFIVEYVKAKKKVKDEDGKETIKEITDLVALGYAYSNNLEPNQLLPVVKPPQETSMRVRWAGEDIPLRFITLKKGNGLQDPCSEDAFHAMPLEAVSVPNFVKDVHTAFPYTFKPVVPNAVEAADAAVPLASEAPDTNVNLKGIVGVGFGAQIPAGVCSQSVLGPEITVQRSND